MYAHIDVSKKVSRVIRYHENKLKRGKAQLIDGNTAKDLGDMSDRDKLHHFQRRNSLNEGTVQNTMHVLVSWPADETVDNTRMRTVAREYIREMGWTDQPYLVYRHDDRQHPHLHIVASNLSREGERLTLHRNDYFRTHALVERLDRQYVQQVEQRVVQAPPKPDAPEPLLPRLSAALDEVVPTYKYTSLAELNAVLDQHQLRVSRCQEDSPTYLTGGLIYVPLTAEGKETGPYIKASVLDSQPTLKHLEERFRENGKGREEDALRVRTAVDWAFYARSPDLEGFRQALRKDQIETVIRRGADGRLTGICYIDERNKSVFEGNSLGENYSASAIERRCEQAAVERQEQTLRLAQEPLTQQPANRLRI